uniref:SFRICE_038423 n=1 Tax=Spodoptera frugiperda TaxID=7108 RepID=A0A2H1WQ96_SPOFR
MIYLNKKLQGSEEEKALVDNAHREHLQRAKTLQQQLKNDMQLAKEDRFTETITFDLQKTLPLPRIPTNIVFFKRQLWVYNLGIHSGSDDQALQCLGGSIQDDIDGFSGTVDFKVEVKDAD